MLENRVKTDDCPRFYENCFFFIQMCVSLQILGQVMQLSVLLIIDEIMI